MCLLIQWLIIVSPDLVALYFTFAALMLCRIEPGRTLIGIQVLLVKRKVVAIAAVAEGACHFQYLFGQKAPVPEGKISIGVEVVPLAAGAAVAEPIGAALLAHRSIVGDGVVVKVVLIDLPDG